MARYEWQERRGGRRYVRIADGSPRASTSGKGVVAPEAVAEGEAVPEIKIDAEGGQATSPRRGRPKKTDAPVVVKDAPDE